MLNYICVIFLYVNFMIWGEKELKTAVYRDIPF